MTNRETLIDSSASIGVFSFYYMKDYTNIKINMLTAVCFIKRQKNKTYWNFKCDCGNYSIKTIDNVFYENIKSCGCLLNSKRANPVNAYFKMYIKASKKRNIEFKLSISDFESFIYNNCSYCGIEPNKDFLKRGVLFNGIDRIDNNKGYEIGNLNTCCEQCNKAKRNLSLSDFNSWIERLINFNKEKNIL